MAVMIDTLWLVGKILLGSFLACLLLASMFSRDDDDTYDTRI